VRLGIAPHLAELELWGCDVAEPLKRGIAHSELVVFDHLSHAGLHEDPETFNHATLEFLLRQRA
jgi:pimeloyl-ACP methyl ester carboxylesterase